jgi:hypothetical protein
VTPASQTIGDYALAAPFLRALRALSDSGTHNPRSN